MHIIWRNIIFLCSQEHCGCIYCGCLYILKDTAPLTELQKLGWRTLCVCGICVCVCVLVCQLAGVCQMQVFLI